MEHMRIVVRADRSKQVVDLLLESPSVCNVILLEGVARWPMAVGIFLDSPILIVGAMVVGPEFGTIAGLCVALMQRRRALATRSALALGLGFPLAIGGVLLLTLVLKATGLTPEQFGERDHQLSSLIANPDFFAFFVAACAGAAGMLSLSTAKSGALIGVLICPSGCSTAGAGCGTSATRAAGWRACPWAARGALVPG